MPERATEHGVAPSPRMLSSYYDPFFVAACVICAMMPIGMPDGEPAALVATPSAA